MAPDPKEKKLKEVTPQDIWRIFLNEGEEGLENVVPGAMLAAMKLEHGLLKTIPSNPRCISCNAPFTGAGAPLMRMIGRQRSNYNPSFCSDCENMAIKNHAQAEVPLTMIFADIRGSTALAEKMPTAEFSNLINRFYQVSSDIVINSKGFVDKFIGDEVSAYFVPGLVGKEHSRIALEVGKEILKQTGHGSKEGPWVPVGVGIHSGPAIVGALGKEGGLNDITVLGDTANTAARLASQAKAGEILASEVTVMQAGFDTTGSQKEDLALKGKDNPVTVWHISI